MRQTHYSPGAAYNHFLGRCEECDSHYLARMSLEEVDAHANQGLIRGYARDAYRHVWATSAVRSAAYDHWKGRPRDSQTADMADRIRAASAARAEEAE